MSRQSFDTQDKRSNKPTLRPLALFTSCYMTLAAVGTQVTGNREFVFYLITMLILIAIVLMVHHRIVFLTSQLWALSLWGLLHMAGGLCPAPSSWPIDGGQGVLYSLWLIPDLLKYDQLVHAYGFGITTWICWHALSYQLQHHAPAWPFPSSGRLTLAAAAGMGFGALNEVIEFIAVLLLPRTNVGGYINTGWDLVFNLIGCLIACFLIRWHYRHRKH
ncbi:MAG: hypothetical protein RL117_138 [Verrucomicrobiota bacterium]